VKVIDGLDLANQQLKNLADGSAATDAVTLQQLQAWVRGVDWKESARAASTANINTASPGASIDGVALAAGERVLLKNQTTGSENGLWNWNGAAAAMTRTADASTSDGIQTLTAGLAVLVTEGTVNHDTAWVLTTDDPIVVGTTALTFNQFGGGSTYTAGNGLTLTGSAFSVVAVSGGGITVAGGGISIDFTKAVAKYSANLGDGSSTTFNVTHNLGSTDVQIELKEIASKEIVFMKVVVTDANTVTLVFPSAPTSGQYRITVQA
jgi:hypothetical protein